MTIEKVLQEKWEIEPNSPLAQIEVEVARICTKMENESVKLDNARLQQERSSLEEELCDLKDAIFNETNGEVIEGMVAKQLGDYLLSKGVPRSELSHPRSNGYHLPIKRLMGLLDYAPELLGLVIEYREKHKRHAMVSRMCKNTGGREFMNVRYDSTHHKMGMIVSVRPNLDSGHYDRYILPAEGKVHIEVSIRDHLVYFLSNYLADSSNGSILKELYQSENANTAIAAVIYGVPYEEVTKEQRRLIKQFLFIRAIDSVLLRGYTLLTLMDSGDKVGESEEAQVLLNLLMSTTPRKRTTYVTPYGRTFRDSTLEFWIRGTSADFDKAFLVLTSKKLDKLTPKVITGGLLIFEVDKADDYSELTAKVTEIYHSLVPSGWIKPKLWVEIRE
jgi:hypothetical protein